MKTSVIQEDIESIIAEFDKELSTLEGKTVFITGGNGLIPSYVIDVIAERNKKTQHPTRLIVMNRNPITEQSRLGHLLNDPNVLFITQDVGKPFDVIGKPHVIMHAASRANPTAFLEDPIDTINANVNATRILLDYARTNSVENVLLFSSAEIYGNPIKEFLPTPEDYSGNTGPLDKYACYTESKRFCEMLGNNYFKKYGVPVKLLRILLTYGPGIRNDGKAVSDFFERAFNDKVITLRDAGEAKRSFAYISDTVRALFAIMFRGANGEAYNIGNDIPSENVTIRKLAEMIAETGGNVSVKPNFDAPKRQVYGEENRWVRIDKLRALGFEPKIMLKEGLARTKRDYDEKRIPSA